MISLPPLWAITGAAGLALGAYAMHTWQKAQHVDAVERGRAGELQLQKGAGQAAVRYADRLLEQQQTADLTGRKFQEVLRAKNSELDSCRVDAELVGLLDAAGTLPGAAGDPGEPRSGPAPAAPAPDSTAAAELATCRANYAEVCIPNAIQLLELREFTRGLIRDYNRAVGRD